MTECDHYWECYDWIFYEFSHRIDFYICRKCQKTMEKDYKDVYPQAGPPKIRFKHKG